MTGNASVRRNLCAFPASLPQQGKNGNPGAMGPRGLPVSGAFVDGQEQINLHSLLINIFSYMFRSLEVDMANEDTVLAWQFRCRVRSC